MSDDRSILRAWNANLEVNRVLLRHLTPAMLQARSPGGGFTVGQHLAHMAGVTKGWGSLIDAQRFEPLPYLAEDIDGELEASADLTHIDDVFRRTSEAAAAAASARPEGSSASPHADAAAYLVHMLVHDAHHRGQILLALKTSDHPLPDEEALWAPWRR